jgi:hypothetical protein
MWRNWQTRRLQVPVGFGQNLILMAILQDAKKFYTTFTLLPDLRAS